MKVLLSISVELGTARALSGLLWPGGRAGSLSTRWPLTCLALAARLS